MLLAPERALVNIHLRESQVNLLSGVPCSVEVVRKVRSYNGCVTQTHTAHRPERGRSVRETRWATRHVGNALRCVMRCVALRSTRHWTDAPLRPDEPRSGRTWTRVCADDGGPRRPSLAGAPGRTDDRRHATSANSPVSRAPVSPRLLAFFFAAALAAQCSAERCACCGRGYGVSMLLGWCALCCGAFGVEAVHDAGG